MSKCYECKEEFKDIELEILSDNGGPIEPYCHECAGFPNHEYRVSCPTCELTILVN